jgi:O-antigen ligase
LRLGSTTTIVAPRSKSFWLASVTIADVGLALALGGGTRQGLWSDALVQLCCLPLLGLAVSRLWLKPLPAHARWPLALIGGIAVLPLLQLVSLPPSVWTSLPGRAPFAAAYQAAGMALPWAPLSLDPGATWLSFLSLLPAISVFLALLFVDLKTRRILSLVILGFAFGSVLLGLAQLAGGPTSPLRFYDPTNPGDSVGFFANRNHYAALLTAAIPISAAWSVGLARDRNSKRSLGFAALLLLAYTVLLLGLGMAHSRAGLVLAFVGGLASTALAWDSVAPGVGRPRRMKFLLFLIGANLCGLLLAFQFGFVGFANRLENESILEDLRKPIAEVTVHAIGANLPAGVGFGAFEPVYQMFEPPAVAIPAYVNHAHDDWLELVLDGGLPALALMLAFMVWYVRASIRAWREPLGTASAVDRALARAGPIVIGLLLLHSTVDYPLRTTSLMVVFAFAAALMISPADTAQLASDPPRKSQRHGRRSAAASAATLARAPSLPERDVLGRSIC